MAMIFFLRILSITACLFIFIYSNYNFATEEDELII